MDNFRRPMYDYLTLDTCNCKSNNDCSNNADKMKKDCMHERFSHEMKNEKSLAMAYVPWQRWNTVFSAEEALCKGTIFPELDLPFLCYKTEMRGGRS